jgi:hypothetical protein
MAKGNHTSKPVMKYCLKLRFFMGGAVGEIRAQKNQWQAQEAAQAPALLDGVEGDVASPPVDTAGAGVAGDATASAEAGTAGAAVPPPLKSVAYQPVPLS